MKKYKWIIALLVVLGMTIGSYLLLVPKGMWGAIPLKTEVLGAVASWTMVGLTAVTAYVFWQTLDSQRAVQKDQEQVLRITLFDRKMKIMPAFVPLNSPATKSLVNLARQPVKVLLKFKVRCENGRADTVSAHLTIFNKKAEVANITRPSIGSADAGRILNLDFDTYYHNGGAETVNDLRARLDIYYQDIDGNKYRQYIKYETTGNEWIGNHSSVFDAS